MYDLGNSGTFGVSIIRNRRRGWRKAVRSALDQRRHLPGWRGFDQRIIDFIIGDSSRKQGVDLSRTCYSLQRLKEAAEKAKIELSNSAATDINLPLRDGRCQRAPST